MISLKEALDHINTNTNLSLEPETIPASQSLGRILAEDHVSKLDLPPFDKSAMDGYAILADDIHNQYQLIETIPAGSVGTKTLLPKTTVKVMTGAPIPRGTGRVVMKEDTRQNEDMVEIYKHDGPNNVCRQGEDMRVGDLILPTGTHLSPLDIANLISCGIVEVVAWRRPKIAILSTGDEIVDTFEDITPGKIMNSNGPMLAALCAGHGFDPICQTTLRDNLEQTVSAVKNALHTADIVLLSGGVSEGEFDYVLKSFSLAGLEVHFSRIAVKPGKPTVFASDGNKLAFGLPGNPVSSFLMFHLFVLSAVAKATSAPSPIRQISLRLSSSFHRNRTERLEFVPCRIRKDATLEAFEYHGSAHLHAVTKADGFFMVPQGIAEIKAGDNITFMPLARVI